MKMELFYEYMFYVFKEYLIKKNIQKLAILFVDLNSVAYELSQVCTELESILIHQ